MLLQFVSIRTCLLKSRCKVQEPMAANWFSSALIAVIGNVVAVLSTTLLNILKVKPIVSLF